MRTFDNWWYNYNTASTTTTVPASSTLTTFTYNAPHCGSCVCGRPEAAVDVPQPPRWKDWLRFAWCMAIDWTEPIGGLYREANRGPTNKIAEWAQVYWHRMHNNRIYSWLNRR